MVFSSTHVSMMASLMEIDKKVPDHFKIETISAPHIPSSRIVDCQCKIKYLLSLEDWFGLDKKSVNFDSIYYSF